MRLQLLQKRRVRGGRLAVQAAKVTPLAAGNGATVRKRAEGLFFQ